MHGDGEVGGQRPRRRRPDHEGCAPTAEPGREGARRRLDLELHVDAGRPLVLVLDLGLGQRRLAVHAPMHGLQTLVHGAPTDEAPELPHDRRLVGRLHRDVGMLPVAEDAEALEFFPLDLDVARGVLAAAADLLERIHGAPHVERRRVEPELLVHLVLDGQTVAVPAGHVDGIVAQHGARFDDEVLEHLVQEMPHVDMAVGVGRPVVEDPQGALGRGLANPAVDVRGLPVLEHLGLELGEIGLHREGRLRQVQRVFVIHRG